MTDKNKQTSPAAPTELAMYKQTVIDKVQSKINEYVANGELNLPANYSANNAVKAAWLVLQSTVDKEKKPALSVCSRDSVANALLDMVVQGLNVHKKQGYFIVYGNKLVFQRSYFGAMAVTKMVRADIDDSGFAYEAVYEEDGLEYEIIRGKRKVTKHTQKLTNIDNDKIKAAYCEIYDKAGTLLNSEIMTMKEIEQAWKQSPMNPFNEKGEIKPGSTHGKFTRDMVLKTVIGKCCKVIINTSSDNTLLLNLINKSEDLADRAGAEAENEEGANNGEVITVTPERPAEPEPEAKKDSEEPEKPKGQIVDCPNISEPVNTSKHCVRCEMREGCPAL